MQPGGTDDAAIDAILQSKVVGAGGRISATTLSVSKRAVTRSISRW